MRQERSSIYDWGLVNVYDLLNPNNPSSTNILALKRLQKIEELLLGLIDDVQGDVQKNVRMMHRLCMDAIEIEREN